MEGSQREGVNVGSSGKGAETWTIGRRHSPLEALAQAPHLGPPRNPTAAQPGEMPSRIPTGMIKVPIAKMPSRGRLAVKGS